MASESTKMFSKLLTPTDIKKRLSIPAKILPYLPDFDEGHAVKIHVMHDTRIWPIICTIRKKGYMKPVFSGGLWRNFVTCNNLIVGDRITMYKVLQVDRDGGSTSHYFKVEVEKPSPSKSNHDVDETSLMMLATVATETSVEQMGPFCISKDIGVTSEAKPPLHSPRDIKFFDMPVDGGAAAYDTHPLDHVPREACSNINTDDQRLIISLDLVLGQPIPYAGRRTEVGGTKCG